MDIDLRISAVFSLADSNDKKETETDEAMAGEFFDTPDHLLPDDENDEVDIMSGFYQMTPPKANKNLPLTDHMGYTADMEVQTTNKFQKDSTSIVEDPDAPPSLILEGSSSSGLPTPSPPIPGIESMSPPILQREEPLKKGGFVLEQSPEKRRCTKIDPCYIVMSNIEPVMKSKTHISSRTFKRSFLECSNMCKKIQFKRRLRAGKDVFNVKTPSKQKDYLFYLDKAEKERTKKGKKTIIQFTQIKEILEKHDLKVAARKRAYGTSALPRIRRTVSRLPNDFASRPKSPIVVENDVTDEVKKDISAEELAWQSRLMVKVELDSLKKLIAIKRSLNCCLKKTKRARTEGFENFLMADVTSSVSGRVRKANRRYGKEFAVFRREIEEQRLLEDAHVRLKRAESENKRRVEDIKKSNERFIGGKKRKESMNVVKNVSDQPDAGKMAKLTDVVIDNAEECNERMFARKHKTLKKVNSDGQGNVEVCTVKGKKCKGKKKKVDRDGVLIQDMPKEENVISGFLQNICFDDTHGKAKTASPSLEANGCIKREPDYQLGDTYVRAKQLLRESLANGSSYARQNVPLSVKPQVLRLPFPVSSVAQGTDNNLVLEQEKYKTLKIPETVQNLFTKEIKKEPMDEDSVTPSVPTSLSTTPRVVTVAYANGVYKKILLNTSTTGQVAQTTTAQTTTAQVAQTGISPAPILVSTHHGLRYLVPKQSLSKDRLPSYSEAIKSLVMASSQVSEKSKNTPVTSTSSVILNATTSVGNISSAMQSPNMTGLPIQHQQQQKGQQSKVLGVLASVPVQTAVNSATFNGQLRPTLPVPTLFVGQSYMNMPAQQAVGGDTNSAHTAALHTKTVVHKVPSVTHPHVSQAPTKLSQSDHANKTIIHPLTLSNDSDNVPSVSLTIPEGQNQKPIDKCKFYLLKIDGKNVLIPIDGDQAQPKAYVVNSDIITGNTQTQNLNTVSSVSASSNIASPSGIRPTILGVQSIGAVAHQKPTLAVLPNLKQLSNVLQNQITSVQNTVSLPQAKSLFQTVTLSGASLVQDTTVESSLRNADSNISSTVTTKTTQKVTSVVKPGLKNLTTQAILPLELAQKNIQTHASGISVPVYIRQGSGASAPSVMQLNVTVDNANNLENVVKSSVYVPPVVINKTVVDHKSQPVGVLSDLLKQKVPIGGKQSLMDALNKKKCSDYGNAMKYEEVNTSGQSNKGTLCEKSGTFVQNDVPEEGPVQSEETPQAFKEAVTSREERLRRLKELLKEKQKAVEEIRSSKSKSE